MKVFVDVRLVQYLIVVDVGYRKDNKLLVICTKLQHTLLKPRNHRNECLAIKLNNKLSTKQCKSNVKAMYMGSQCFMGLLTSSYVQSPEYVHMCVRSRNGTPSRACIVRPVDWESTNCGHRYSYKAHPRAGYSIYRFLNRLVLLSFNFIE